MAGREKHVVVANLSHGVICSSHACALYFR
jgi:hypothetical protein